jgi:wyosine [tRNA(Phe)-imidazoG37] synthetase (radical SAM superfamily)
MDKRPANYRYLGIFTDHLKEDASNVFNGKVIYPRQMEVHLPSDRKTACNFHCAYCQGKQVSHLLDNWEENGLRVMEQLKGQIPYYIYGGVYTEPLMNEYFPDYIKMTKKYNNNFGIHTNGSLFQELEEKNGFCSLLINSAQSSYDYISVSLDGGTIESHKKVKNVKKDWFTEIMKGLKTLVKLRGDSKYPSIRVCYLMTPQNSSREEIMEICTLMKDLKVDSLRFSVPYDHYGKVFDRVRKYRNNWEVPFGEKCEEKVRSHLSPSMDSKPYIFWHPPGFQDVEKMNFKQCVYSYYQITFGADGYVYKCSSTAAPEFTHARLGKVPGNLKEFDKMVLANHESKFKACSCFNVGARCNRIALEINQSWNKGELFANQEKESPTIGIDPEFQAIAQDNI